MDNKPINEHIPYDTLLVINSDGRNLGEMTKTDALALAEEQELDLILLAPKRENSLAIAKIVNYGKYLYEQKAKSKDNRQKTIKVKEITVKPQIGDHDLT
jgi:translation initiation factor IF-3